jgi:sugar lactone lactonase YvrE
MFTASTEIIHRGLSFGESPRFFDGAFYFSDFFRHGVFRLDADGTETLVAAVEGQPSGLGQFPNGDLAVVSMTDHRLLRLGADGVLCDHGSLAPHAGYWANDLVLASDGTAYVGSFGFDLDTFLATHGPEGVLTPPGPPTTSLIRVDPDGGVSIAAEDLLFPNGTVLTADESTLIVAETLAMRLTAFDRADDGTLGRRRQWARFELACPDGICLDANGEIWIANALAPECLRVKEGGEITGRVTTQQHAFACMLGGDDGATLMVMTAPTSTAAVVRDQRLGTIEAVAVDVPHAGRP